MATESLGLLGCGHTAQAYDEAPSPYWCRRCCWLYPVEDRVAARTSEVERAVLELRGIVDQSLQRLPYPLRQAVARRLAGG